MVNVNELNKGETWESQIELALTHNINASYAMFMALNMDKDKVSHVNIDNDTWSKLSKMMLDHDELMKVKSDKAIPYKVRLTEDESVRLAEAMDMNLSEVKANPIECYSEIWDLTITNVFGLITVGNKQYKVDYTLED